MDSWFRQASAAASNFAGYVAELKDRAARVVNAVEVQRQGYFSAEQDDEVRALLASYCQCRNAMLDLVQDCQTRVDRGPADNYDAIFLVGYATSCVLVDAARFLRDVAESKPVIRRRLNQPVPEFNIEGGTYDRVQKSLVSVRHGWRLLRARQYFVANRDHLRDMAEQCSLVPLWEVAERLSDQLDVSVDRFARVKVNTRVDQWVRATGRNLVQRNLYGVQRLFSSMMADVYLRSGHQPQLPERIVTELAQIIRPGDVMVVRKEHALTNYFLPGHWPHAALYLGTASDLNTAGLASAPAVARCWPQIECPHGTPRVFEAMKDGVRIRQWNSALACDSVVLLRPLLPPAVIATALARVLEHEGKSYDFDFDFGRSDRLVCTEVIYRAYDGVEGTRIPLTRRAGRPTFSGLDLVRLALDRQGFEVITTFVPQHAPSLVDQTHATAAIKHVLENG